MRVHHFLPLLLALFTQLDAQQLGIPRQPEKFYLMEIRSALEEKEFEFDLVKLSRTGKKVDFQQHRCKAPFKLALYDEAIVMLYARAGRAKVSKQYRMTDQFQAYQYFEQGEALVIEFFPKPVGGGPTQSWSEGLRTAPRLTVTLMHNEQ